MIHISKPYLTYMHNEAVRLNAFVDYGLGGAQEIWYEVEAPYGEHLNHERADAFVLAFLPWAMAFEHDMVVDAPVSERLWYQLTNYYIPALAKFTKGYYKYITIQCDTLDAEDYAADAVGVATGFSAGVDSFYTVLKHLDNPATSYNLTHLTFFKVGATGSFGGAKADDTYRRRVAQFRSYADAHNLEFVTVDSNVSEHAKMSINYIHTFRSLSTVLALQKLFHIYYYSSAETINDFCLNVVDSANYDSFSLNCFAVEGVQLYSVGLDCERLEKQNFIKDYEETYDYLNVCNSEADNCSHCEKSLRTMAGFHCLGSLEKYKKTFDVEYYKANLSKCLGYLLGRSFDGSPEGNTDAALIRTMRDRGVRIPAAAYVHAVPTAARSIKPIRKWYHKRMHEELGCNYVD